MKYVPPLGVSDPESSYINGDANIGREGSIPPAAAFENPQREIVSVINRSGIIPSDADLQQLAKAVQSQRMNYVDDAGGLNNLDVRQSLNDLGLPLAAYTRGLVLRVRIRNTNTGPVRINAGPGNVPVRKMNGADVAENELPAGALATLVYDGTVFQLSNFGGGAAGDIHFQQVKIPYTEDRSTTPNIIRADFLPPLAQLGKGDMIAVKIANTNNGPTVIFCDDQPSIELRPNGGGMMLQGDIVKDDIVIMFFDGVNFFFAPNPEISEPVTYSIGPGMIFPLLSDAMDALHRKTIGANGYVDLWIRRGEYGPLTLSHPSADRIRIRGEMIGAAPRELNFARTGNTQQARNQDANLNLLMLRGRFGTIINIPEATGIAAIRNEGPGTPLFQDLLVVGTRRPFVQFSNGDWGIRTDNGHSIQTNNVVVWGAQTAIYDAGNCFYLSTWIIGATRRGFWTAGAGTGYINCHAFGCGGPSNEVFGAQHGEGWVVSGGGASLTWCSVQMNVNFGLLATAGGGVQFWYSRAYGNGSDPTSVPPLNYGADLIANSNSNVHIVYGPGKTHAGFGTCIPPIWTQDISGAIITDQEYWPDPGPNPYT